MIKVMLFDDNALIRDSIEMLIDEYEDIELIASFDNCINVINELQKNLCDVVLMDIDMPGMSGIEGVKLIRKHFPSVQVLMQTVFEDEDKIFSSIAAGAGGYILKNANGSKLIEAIHEVHFGGAPMTPSIAKKILLHLQAPMLKHEEYHLSTRENEVLKFLVEGLSYKMIADKMGITYDTVRAHIKKIYEKLHVSSMTEAVAKAIHQNMFH